MKLLVFLVPLIVISQSSAQVADDFEESTWKQREISSLYRLQKASSAQAGRNLDVHYYGLRLRLFPETGTLEGSVVTGARIVADSASEITMDLMGSLVVDSVRVGDTVVAFTRTSTTVTFPLLPARPRDSLVTFEIFYHGPPANSGFGSFAFAAQPGTSIPWMWSLSEPYGAPDWWPCKDTPTDKADSIDVWITCDQNLKAASQGKLVSVTSNIPGTNTYHWKHRYPISTYLVSIAVTTYAEFSDWFRYSPTDSMQILNYVLPVSLPIAQTALARTVPMLEIFSDLFGLYPFITEKYGHAQFGWGGGMEHQTITSLGGFSETLVAHELAHQWFGDMITMETWPDIWLNEGFATYSPALYYERRYGVTQYRSYMNTQMNQARQARGLLYVLDTTNIAALFDGNLVYAKGATVLHMLRHVVGDSAFFNGLRSYALDPRFRFGNASTADLQDVFEQTSGVDLDYFFQEWIYGESYPRYVYSWSLTPEAGQVRVRFSLSQSTGGSTPLVFRMPLDIRLQGIGGDTTIVVFNDSLEQSWEWLLPFVPDVVALDPDGWVLKTVVDASGNGAPRDFFMTPNFPNPFNGTTTLYFRVPVKSRVRFEVFDALGRMVDFVDESERDPGLYEITWNAKGPSGVYFLRMNAVPTVPFSETRVLVRKLLYVK